MSELQETKFRSRKWRLVLLVLGIAALALLIPPILSIWVFSATEALVILGGTEFVSLATLVVTAYFGANVWQKRIEGQNSLEVKTSMNLSADLSADVNNEDGEA